MQIGDDLEFEITRERIELNPAREWIAFVQYLRDGLPFHVTERPFIFERDGAALATPGFDSGDSLVAVAFMFDEQRAVYFSKVDRTPSDAEIGVWRSSVSDAVARLQEEPESHAWWSIVGQVGDHRFPSVRLSGLTFDYQGTSIVNSGKPHSEPVENEGSRSLSGASTRTSYPLIIKGMSKAPNWNSASGIAAAETNRVAALLSLLSGVPWQMREAPRPDVGAALDYPEWGGCTEDGWSDVHLRAEDVAIDSSKFSALMVKLKTTHLIPRAVYMHWQGLLVEQTTASMSFICHVSVIETIGQQLLDWHSNEPGVNFRSGIGAVYGDSEQFRILKDLYGRYRHKIVHSGHLVAGEEFAGSMYVPTSAFEESFSDLRFRVGPLRTMRAASRRVQEFYALERG